MSALSVTQSPSPASARAHVDASPSAPAKNIHVRTPRAISIAFAGPAACTNRSGRPMCSATTTSIRSILPRPRRLEQALRHAEHRHVGQVRRGLHQDRRRALRVRGVDDELPPRRAPRRAPRNGRRVMSSSSSLRRGWGSPRSHGSSMGSSSQVPQRRTSCPSSPGDAGHRASHVTGPENGDSHRRGHYPLGPDEARKRAPGRG